MAIPSHSNSNNNNPNGAAAKKKRRYAKPKRTLDPQITFDYKDAQLLRRFVTEHGKIVPRRISGASASQQRQLTLAVKRARIMAILGYGHNEVR